MLRGCQEPTARSVAPGVRDDGGDACELADGYGLKPDPWQELTVTDWLQVTASGQWANTRCGLSVPRQNGKNAIIEVRELFGMVVLGEKFLHTAHEVKTARKAFARLRHFFGEKANDPNANYPELNAMVAEIRHTNGQEAIVLANGGSVEFAARSKGSGRGYTVDVLVLDEAQALTDEQLEALRPTTSAAPLGNPQTIYIGTPPGPNVSGEVLTRIRAEGLKGADRLAWSEWAAEEGDDPDSPDVWAKANPGLGYRLTRDAIADERGEFSDEGFARERLGMWGVAGSAAVIDAATWKARLDESSVAVDRLVLAVDVDPERTRGSVAIAGLREDGLVHVEIDEIRDGTGWIVQYVTDVWERNDVCAVVIDAAGAAGSLVADLEAAKVKVVETGARDVRDACGQFYDAVVERGSLRHIGQPQLAVSLASARKRPLADGWAWNRKNTSSDITQVVAATLALWGVNTPSKVRKRRRRRAKGGVLAMA